jgi:hypothetical protein
VVLFFVFGIFVSCASRSQVQSQFDFPLAIDDSVYNFEFAGPSQLIAHEFTFTNTRQTAVSIADVSVCCGCQANSAELLNTPIAPGQQGAIMITCTMPRYEGPVEKEIQLRTDIESSDPIPLTIKGVVKRDIVLIPSALSFGSVTKGTIIQKRFRVLQVSSQKLEIRKVDADKDLYTVETKRFDDINHRGFEVTVAFLANVDTGGYSDVITLHTNDQRRPRVDVPIVAQIIE